MLDPVAIVAVVVANVVVLGAVATAVVLLLRRGHRRRTMVDERFRGAPAMPATVVERTHLGWGHGERWAYDVSYRVEPAGSAPFIATERRMMTTLIEAPRFARGTRLLVAVRPDLGEVQAVPSGRS